MASVITNDAKKNILQAWVDGATSVKMMLLDSNHANDIDAQEFIDDVSTNQVTGTGYTAGGQTVSGISVSADDVNDRAEMTFSDIVWDASGGSLTASFAVLYDDTGTPGTSQILAIYDFGASQTADNDTFTISSDAEGSVQIS